MPEHPTIEDQIRSVAQALKLTMEEVPPFFDGYIRDMFLPYIAKWKKAYYDALLEEGFDELQAMQIVKNENTLDALAFGGQFKT